MKGSRVYSTDSRLNRLLNLVVNELSVYAECQLQQIERLAQIGIALSAEKDINKLLELIIDEAMDFTNADAGTLYIVDEEQNTLQFRILKNLSLNTHLGGTSGLEVNLPPVPLEKDKLPNYSNVSSFSALKAEIVNIPDVYETNDFDFSGPKAYDGRTGYRSRSMLVIPMKNHENEVIGVLQLLNAKDAANGEVIPFAREYVGLIASLASQAAVALENAELIRSLKDLFDAVIRSIASAIDEKSAYTGGHIRRVTELTMMIAHRINDCKNGLFGDVKFTEDQLEELRIAAWMHDVGKITTPEHVVDKSHKLETVFNRIELIEARFAMIGEQLKAESVQKKLELSRSAELDTDVEEKLDQLLKDQLAELFDDLDFIRQLNHGSEMVTEDYLQRLKNIAEKVYNCDGKTCPWLTKNEFENLSIRRGTLTTGERRIIENHALVSINFLKQLPFPKKLARVPEYAGGHHEKLDGSGYPFGLTADQLPLQARIMALADIFEALTASDRPYKAPMKLSRAMSILQSMCEKNHIDPDIFQLFKDCGMHLEYAEKELKRDQIDLP